MTAAAPTAIATRYRSEFGNHVKLTPINNNNNNKKNKKKENTKTIKISEQLYKRFVEHSRKYYNVETYETILKNLLDCFDKHNEDVRWYNNK